MKKDNFVVALYNSHSDAEMAVKLIEQSGLDMKNCSILSQGYHTEEDVIGYYNSGDRMMVWGKEGAFWGSIWGLLFGSGVFWIPGVGQVMAGGAIVSSIVGALEGAVVVGGLSSLGAGLYSIGIPENSALRCEAAIKANKFVVIFHGTAAETITAKEIFDSTPSETVEINETESIDTCINV